MGSKTGTVSDGSERETTASPAAQEFDLDFDEVFDVLRNQRRRHVLRYLDGETEAQPLGDIAEHVAARELEKSREDLTSSERKRVYIGLYQAHLPRMDDMCIVEFDDDRKTVQLGPNGPRLLRHLSLSCSLHDGGERPWHRYYLAVGVGGVALLTASVLGAASVGVTAPAVAAVTAVAVLAVALAHSVTPRTSCD